MSMVTFPLTRWSPLAPKFIGAGEALLALWLAIVLADLCWTLLPEPAPVNPAAWRASAVPAAAGTVVATAPPSAAARALFGAAPDNAAFAGPIAEAQLNLTLKGILSERDSARQVALIADAAGEEKVYAKGDHVADATVAWIEPRRVVLARDGHHEALTWRIDERAEAYRATAAAANAPATPAPPDVRRQLPDLLRQAQTEPYLRDGRPAGFRLVWIDPESIINHLGLRPDDVIRAVNDIAVDDTADLLNAYQQLQEQTTIRVSVLRGDEVMTFDVPVN